ncbi:unnamed protein product, partial [Laminaria digitata]
MHQQLRFQCREGHEWLSTPSNLVYKNVRNSVVAFCIFGHVPFSSSFCPDDTCAWRVLDESRVCWFLAVAELCTSVCPCVPFCCFRHTGMCVRTAVRAPVLPTTPPP